MLNLIARRGSKQASPAPNPHLRMTPPAAPGRDAHRVGNINDKVLAPDKTWFQKCWTRRPTLSQGLEALFYDDRQLARCIKMGVYPDKANPKGFDFKSDQYDTHVEKGNANIGIEYGRGRGGSTRTSAHAEIAANLLPLPSPHVRSHARAERQGANTPEKIAAREAAQARKDAVYEEYVAVIEKANAWAAKQNGKGKKRARSRTPHQGQEAAQVPTVSPRNSWLCQKCVTLLGNKACS
eukprot:tig00021013_g17035.t1